MTKIGLGNGRSAIAAWRRCAAGPAQIRGRQAGFVGNVSRLRR
jgi:hypothetical protein